MSLEAHDSSSAAAIACSPVMEFDASEFAASISWIANTSPPVLGSGEHGLPLREQLQGDRLRGPCVGMFGVVENEPTQSPPPMTAMTAIRRCRRDRRRMRARLRRSAAWASAVCWRS